jgi:MFS family permease
MPSRKGATFAIVILFLINILNFYDRNIAGALVEPMRKEFHLDDTQVGLLGTAFTVLYAIIGVPLGRVADLWSRKRLLGGGMVIWGVLTAFAAVVTSFAGLMVSRLGVGVGEAACAPTATSWIGDLVAPSKRARALALFMLGVPVGGALSYFFSGPIAQAYGWRTAMVIAAVPAFLLLPALLSLHEPERGASETHATKEAPASMLSVLRIPTLWWIVASGALLNFNMYAIGTFMPALLGRIHGLKVGPAGIATGILYITGGIAGGLLAGWIGDRIIHKRKNGRLIAAAVISLGGAPFAYFGAMQPKGALIAAVALWTVAYGSLNSYYGLVYSSIQDIVAPAQRGATMALYFMAMYLCGASFGPLLTGRLSDHFARVAADAAGSVKITDAARAIGLQQAILIVPLLSVMLAFVLYMGSRTIASDISRREAAADLARIA